MRCRKFALQHIFHINRMRLKRECSHAQLFDKFNQIKWHHVFVKLLHNIIIPEVLAEVRVLGTLHLNIAFSANALVIIY